MTVRAKKNAVALQGTSQLKWLTLAECLVEIILRIVKLDEIIFSVWGHFIDKSIK